MRISAISVTNYCPDIVMWYQSDSINSMDHMRILSISVTNYCPDIVLWYRSTRQVILVELMVPPGRSDGGDILVQEVEVPRHGRRMSTNGAGGGGGVGVFL